MTSRSRTSLFKQYRDSFLSSRNSRLFTNSGYNTSNTSEHTGLIESSDHIIELSVLPPKWADIVEEVNEDIDHIKNLVTKLESFHRKHVLPGFDDRTGEEEEIERRTTEITQLFQQCQRKIRQIADQSKSTLSSQELVINKNIQTSLATKVQDLSASFRKQQSVYMKKLKGRETRSSDLFSIDNEDSLEEYGFTETQLQVVESSDVIIAQREHEINEIVKSINTLAEIFKDLQTLVIDHGTILDRIDFNIEQMVFNVKSAVNELDKGGNYQKKSRNRKIILLLLLIIFGLIIILVFKPRRH